MISGLLCSLQFVSNASTRNRKGGHFLQSKEYKNHTDNINIPVFTLFTDDDGLEAIPLLVETLGMAGFAAQN